MPELVEMMRYIWDNGYGVLFLLPDWRSHIKELTAGYTRWLPAPVIYDWTHCANLYISADGEHIISILCRNDMVNMRVRKKFCVCIYGFV